VTFRSIVRRGPCRDCRAYATLPLVTRARALGLLGVSRRFRSSTLMQPQLTAGHPRHDRRRGQPRTHAGQLLQSYTRPGTHLEGVPVTLEIPLDGPFAPEVGRSDQAKRRDANGAGTFLCVSASVASRTTVATVCTVWSMGMDPLVAHQRAQDTFAHVLVNVTGTRSAVVTHAVS
jgi:hypothetical protein